MNVTIINKLKEGDDHHCKKNFKPQNITCHATPHVSHTSMLKKVITCRSNKGDKHHQGYGWGGSVTCYMLMNAQETWKGNLLI
jgi:hypothetical protein